MQRGMEESNIYVGLSGLDYQEVNNIEVLRDTL